MQAAMEKRTEKTPSEVHICPQLGRTVLFLAGQCLSFTDCAEPDDCPFLLAPGTQDLQRSSPA